MEKAAVSNLEKQLFQAFSGAVRDSFTVFAELACGGAFFKMLPGRERLWRQAWSRSN